MQNIEYAAVIGHTEHTVLYADDVGTVYFRSTDSPETFELGTVEEISDLTPFCLAEDPVKGELLAFVGGGE